MIRKPIKKFPTVPERLIQFCLLSLGLLTGMTGFAQAQQIMGTEQFNPNGEIEGSGWANLYSPVDNSLSLIPYVVIDGMAVYQGDILLGSADGLQNSTVLTDDSIQQSVATASLGRRWQDGQVPYVIDPAHSFSTQILDAMDYVEQNTSIRFVNRSNEADYIEIVPGSGCSSFIGRVGGRQPVSIANGCQFRGIIAHELYHALAMYHEQSRSDRDQFITVNFGNIRAGFEHNFNLAPNSLDIGPYDYSSVMHYGNFAFSVGQNLATISTPAGISIGQRSGLSQLDINAMQFLYYTDLRLELDTVAQINPGAEFQAAIRITNQGDSQIGDIIAKDLSISLPLPAGSSYDGFSSTQNWQCQQQSQNLNCTLDQLDRQQSSLLNLNLSAPVNGSSMQLIPVVSLLNRDIQSANNSETATVNILNLTDLDLETSLSRTTVNTGEIVTMQINLNNISQTDATQVALNISLPNALDFSGFNGSDWNCSDLNTSISCALSNLDQTTSSVLSLNFIAVSEEPNASISAIVSSQVSDSNLTNNSTQTELTINAAVSVVTPPTTTTSTNSKGAGSLNFPALLFIGLIVFFRRFSHHHS